MAGEEGSLKRCVLSGSSAAEAGEKMSMKPCTAQGTAGRKPCSAQETSKKKAGGLKKADEAVTRCRHAPPKMSSNKRKGVPATGASDPVVEVIDGEEVVVPAGKLLLSRGLVDKILAIQRRPFSFTDEEIGSESDDELRESLKEDARAYKASQDKFVQCQAKIQEHRHEKGYALVDDDVEVRVAMGKALDPFVERYHRLGEEGDEVAADMSDEEVEI